MKLSLSIFVLLIMSAISLVTARHDTRKLVNEIELERNKALQIERHHTNLVTEKATLTSPSRIERLAIQKLKMKYPKREDIVLLPPPPARAKQ
mgnify:CR=1 FL=1